MPADKHSDAIKQMLINEKKLSDLTPEALWAMYNDAKIPPEIMEHVKAEVTTRLTGTTPTN